MLLGHLAYVEGVNPTRVSPLYALVASDSARGSIGAATCTQEVCQRNCRRRLVRARTSDETSCRSRGRLRRFQRYRQARNVLQNPNAVPRERSWQHFTADLLTFSSRGRRAVTFLGEGSHPRPRFAATMSNFPKKLQSDLGRCLPKQRLLKLGRATDSGEARKETYFFFLPLPPPFLPSPFLPVPFDCPLSLDP